MSLTATLTDEQERSAAAIDAFVADPRRRTFCLQGLAGTGKTTVLAHMAQQYDHAALCTLTGKAASVLRQRVALPASTIHGFFYRLVEAEKRKNGRRRLSFEPAHDDDELASELCFLDECSVVSETLVTDMLRAGVKIVASGEGHAVLHPRRLQAARDP